MKEFKNGVSYYTQAMVAISFPEDDICCYRCPLMGTEYKPNREYCRRTGEYLPSPMYTVGFECPLKFTEEEQQNA